MKAIRKTVIEALKEFKDKKYLFRGQADSSWSLKTSFDRRLSRSHLRFDHYFSETDRLYSLISKKLEKAIPYSSVDKWKNITFYNYLQHYRYPTPFLDWSSNIEIALFFAAISNDLESESALFVIDPISVKKVQSSISYRGSYFDKENLIEIYNVCESSLDDRVINQESHMSICNHVDIYSYLNSLERVGREQNLIKDNEFIIKKIILMDNKKNIKSYLDKVGITEQYVLPEKHKYDIGRYCKTSVDRLKRKEVLLKILYFLSKLQVIFLFCIFSLSFTTQNL